MPAKIKEKKKPLLLLLPTLAVELMSQFWETQDSLCCCIFKLETFIYSLACLRLGDVPRPEVGPAAQQ